MDRKWWITVLLLVLFFRAQSQNDQFVLQGTITNAPVEYLYLRYTNNTGRELVDSSRVQNGSFSFKGKINQPTRAILRANRTIMPDDQNLNIVVVYLEPTRMQVHVGYNHFKAIKVSGSKTQREFELLTAQQVPLGEKYMMLRDSLNQLNQQKASTDKQGNSQAQRDRIGQLSKQLIKNMRSVSYQFIREHPNSWVSGSELASLRSEWPIDTVRQLFNQLSVAVQQSGYGQLVASKIQVFDQAKSSIGAPAFNFSATELNGETIKLSDFKGRYVLLDFWGSWCAPCRAGNSHLLELYEHYQKKGIEFISIACDDTPAAWRKAIEKDGIGHWKHVLDTGRGDNKAGDETSIQKRYAVDSFPTKLIIDPNGVVIGRHKGDEDAAMTKQIEALFN